MQHNSFSPWTTCTSKTLYIESNFIISLKPQNVMICKDGYIKIVDFGLCKRNYLSPQVFSVSGTTQYLAPQILERKPCSEALDWWTLGSIIYEMLEGQPPFYSQNKQQIFVQIKKVDVKVSPKLSPECRDLINKLLAKKPQNRLGYSDPAQIQNHPWFAKIKWDKIMNKEYTAPYIPQLKHELDIRHFDKQFTQLNIESFSEPTAAPNKLYEDFSFQQQEDL